MPVLPLDPITLDALDGFEARQSSDIAKTDLELTCSACGEHLCDIEHGDTLSVLARTAADHECEAYDA